MANIHEVVAEHFREPTYYAHLEPRIPTLEKPVIICVDVVGARITKDQNPHLPCRPREIATELVESVRAGATIGHLHVRDENCVALEDPEKNHQVWDMVFSEVEDVVTSNHIMYDRTARGMDMFRGYIDPLTNAGTRDLQVAAVPTTDFSEPRGRLVYTLNDEELVELIDYLEQRGVKPEIQMYAPSSVERIKHSLLDRKEAIKRPIWINAHLGKHHSVPVSYDPWSYIQVITWYQSVRAELAGEDVVLGVYVGGRNWLPLTVLAIMMGADVIRVGMEDSLYTYPHKDELISSNRSVVKKVVRIAKELGRPIASVNDTRSILGITAPEMATV